MVYRERALVEPQSVDDSPDRTLLRLDVSGRPGRSGRHGSNGSHAGNHGDPAGRAEEGQEAGAIEIHLAPSPSAPDDQLILTGRLTLPDGTHQDGRNEIAFYDGGFIDLLAIGGAGGHGGKGGDGAKGHTGSRGSNATRYSSGGNGGPGGRGGSGGAGSSGALGGAGGEIQLSVSADDTHLLMLARNNVAGGAGGAPGRNGRGGPGGSGGAGGSGYSWTTKHRYTDSQGKRRTRTRRHRKPGGSRGPTGPSGRNATATLHPGRQGAVGRFEIVVKDADGTEARYDERFRLQLVGFGHVSANQDGVYEPLERIEVSGLVVRNTGGMPTPPNHPVHLMLEPEGWVWPEADAHLILPASLPADAVTPVEGSLFFSIGDWVPEGPSDPLEVTDHIVHGAILPAAHRAFEGYHGAGDAKGRFVVRYPVRASHLESLHGLAPGEAACLRFSLRSVSERSFGVQGDIPRRVRFRLSGHESELGEPHVRLLAADDRPVPYDNGWLKDLPLFGAGERLDFEATIALDPSTPHYQSARLRLSLELETPDDTAQVRAIQLREFVVRVAQRYRRVEGCELLLVTCHQTTREQMDAWLRLSERAGLPMAVWDVSLEGHLDLQRELGGGTLEEHLRGGTVVILNPPMETPGGEVRPHKLFDSAQIEALVDARISVAIFGGEEGEVPLSRWLIPGDGAAAATTRESCAVFREHLEKLEVLRGDDAEPVEETIDVHHIGFWFEPPTQERLDARALTLSRYLRAEYPNRRFIVSPRFEPEEVSSYGVVRRWRVGALKVRSTLDASRSHLLHWTKTPDADDLDSGRAEQMVLLARDFDQKVDQLAEALRAERDTMPAVRAILVDLVNEQQAILASRWRHGLSSADMALALPLLRKLVQKASSLEAPSLDHSYVEPLIELAARLSNFSKRQTRWWEWPLYPARRAPRLRRMTQGYTDAWLQAVFLDPSADEDENEARVDAARARVRARVAAYEVERESLEPVPTRRYHAHSLMREPIEWDGVTTDAERLLGADHRVVDALRHREIRAAERDEATLRATVSNVHGQSRERLLRQVRVEAPATPLEEPQTAAVSGGRAHAETARSAERSAER